MNTTTIQAAFRNFWVFLWQGWRQRDAIAELCSLFDALPAHEKELREQIFSLHSTITALTHAKELSVKEAQVVTRELTDAKAELKTLQEKYSQLLIRKEAPEERVARDALALAQLEIADLNKRLVIERESKEKLQRHVNKMWQFIALRHRIDLPAQQGTIRNILQEAEGR